MSTIFMHAVANAAVDTYSQEELKSFVFDRIVDELKTTFNDKPTGKYRYGELFIDWDNKTIYKEIK